MTGQTGRGFLATARLLFCAKDASGQVNFHDVCLVLLFAFIHF